MQQVVEYSLRNFRKNEAVDLSAGVERDIADRHLANLWAKACKNDLKAYEGLHEMLYPQLFNYVSFILNSSIASDLIISDAFIKFWQRKGTINGSDIKISFIRYVRHKLLAYLANKSHKWIDKNNLIDKELSEISLLTVLNSSLFKEMEASFFLNELKLDHTAVLKITNNDMY